MIDWRLVSNVPRMTSSPLTHWLSAPKGNHTPMHSQTLNAFIPHAPSSRVEYSLASLHQPHYGCYHTLGVETTQLGVVWWDHRSRWAYGHLFDSDESIYQWRCDPMSCLPNVPQRGDIDLGWWNPTKIHRQLHHHHQMLQCAVRNQ